MSLELEPCPTVWGRPRRDDITTLRTELMNVKEELLSEIYESCCQHHKTATDCQTYQSLTDHVLAKLRSVEHTLNALLEPSSGICGSCQKAIPIAQLMLRPDSSLCATCIEERLDLLSGDAL